MSMLYRCRTSLREVAEHLGAAVPTRAEWAGEMRPGRTGLIVHNDASRRAVSAMCWGLAFGDDPQNRATAFLRELWPDQPALLDAAARCLIVLDSFAAPDGPPGARTTTWYGFEDTPIFAWAGVCDRSGRVDAFCGLITGARPPVGPGRTMPALLSPEECEIWLTADLVTAGALVRGHRRFRGLYREPTEELWSANRGRS